VVACELDIAAYRKGIKIKKGEMRTSPSPATNSIWNGITPSHPDNRVAQLFWSKP